MAAITRRGLGVLAVAAAGLAVAGGARAEEPNAALPEPDLDKAQRKADKQARADLAATVDVIRLLADGLPMGAEPAFVFQPLVRP